MIDLYKTTSLLKAVNQIKPVHTFLRDTFFPHALNKTLLTETVMIDTKKGKRKMAPFVAPHVGGVTMDREGFVTSTITAPKIAPQRATHIDDIIAREFGESIISTKTPAQRQAGILARDLADLSEMIERREEWMIRELLFNGEVPIKGYIDFGNKNFVEQTIKYGDKEEVTPKAKWNVDTASIIEDLRKWRLDIIQKTGKAPNTLIVASDVVEAILKNKELKDLFDIKNYNLGTMQPKIKSESITYVGSISAVGVDIYSYDEWVIDDTGKEVPMVPAGKVLLGSKNLGEIRYGLVTQMEKGEFKSYEGVKVPKSWSEDNNDTKIIRLTSRPVPVPYDIETWKVATVL